MKEIRSIDHKITEEINMSGQYGMVMCYIMHCKLEEAFRLLSATQQCPMSTDPPGSMKAHEDFCEEASSEIDQIAKEICMGLTGKKIKFIEKSKEES